MEKELKRTKKIAGITLIALVITIVVLIILAGVLINISLGNNGLFNKAKTAKEMYTNAQAQEETEIAKITNNIDGYVGGNRDYETEINTLKSRIAELENLNSYSTTEKVIGTWIDGITPVYQKTFQGSYSLTTSTSIISSIVIPNAMHLLDVKCIQDDGIVGDYYIASPSIAGFTSEYKLRMATTKDLTAKYIILTYTKAPESKTTD